MKDPVTIETARLILRLPHAGDATAVLAMMTDPDTAQWNPAPSVIDERSAVDWCVRNADWSGESHATWVVAERVTGTVCGTVSVHSINPRQQDAEIGYRVHPAARRRGFATEAVAAATTWAFANLSLVRIELVHAVANWGSCVVATRCGYQMEGNLRQSFLYGDGVRYDEHLHARLLSDDV